MQKTTDFNFMKIASWENFSFKTPMYVICIIYNYYLYIYIKLILSFRWVQPLLHFVHFHGHI